MGKNPSLVKQVTDKLLDKMEPGRSKYADKLCGINPDCIYSYETLKTYLRQCVVCVKWALAEHGCRTLDEVKAYVPEYLRQRIDEGKSPHTVHTDAAAISKL